MYQSIYHPTNYKKEYSLIVDLIFIGVLAVSLLFGVFSNSSAIEEIPVSSAREANFTLDNEYAARHQLADEVTVNFTLDQEYADRYQNVSVFQSSSIAMNFTLDHEYAARYQREGGSKLNFTLDYEYAARYQ